MYQAHKGRKNYLGILIGAVIIMIAVAAASTGTAYARPKKTPVPTTAVPTATATPVVTTTPVATSTPSVSSGFIKGFDASYVSRVEANGGVYKTSSGQVQDVFQILADNGVNYVRFRVWNSPDEGYCNKADVLAMVQRAKAAGLDVLIDFHYSDFWADPSQQNKPAAWESMTLAQLNQAVYDYTYDVISSLIAQGTPPDMVQIGNEVTHGMLWTDGMVIMDDASYDTATQWANFASMVNSGISAVEDTGSDAEIMMQIASGDLDEMTWFFDNLIANHVDFDIVGISYYHNWHGNISDLNTYVTTLASRYGKEVVIAETSYPFTLDWYDWTNNILGLQSQLLAGYDATVSGQTAFLQAVVDVVQDIPNDLGRGVFYWGGEWIATSSQDTNGSTWENQALFNFQWKALSTFSVFQNIP